MHVFTRDSSSWGEFYFVESSVVDGSDAFGFDVAVDGSTVLVSAPFDSTTDQIGKTYFITK